jgi:hypothetical protein
MHRVFRETKTVVTILIEEAGRRGPRTLTIELMFHESRVYHRLPAPRIHDPLNVLVL